MPRPRHGEARRGAARTYQAGQAWFEPKGILHVFAENPSAQEPAAILATFVTDEGCGPLVTREPQPMPSGS